MRNTPINVNEVYWLLKRVKSNQEFHSFAHHEKASLVCVGS
jgi:hypothetical protein